MVKMLKYDVLYVLFSKINALSDGAHSLANCKIYHIRVNLLDVIDQIKFIIQSVN